MSQARRWLVLAAALGAAALVWQLGTRFFAVDRCLDAGGRFDHAAGICDQDASRP